MKKRILEYIQKHKAEKGYAPEPVDIARALDTTRQNVNYHFHRLKDELADYPEYKKYLTTSNA